METKKYENVTIYKIVTIKGTIEAYPEYDNITLYYDQSNKCYYFYIDNTFIKHILSDEGDLEEVHYDDYYPDSYETYFWLQEQNKNMIEGIIKEYARFEYDNIVRQIEALQREEDLYKRYLGD